MNDERNNELIKTLKNRFEKNMLRHIGILWDDVQNRIGSNPEHIQALSEMERTGGEPDIIGFDEVSGAYVFCDCSPETPEGRRSLCYDREALDGRKANKPNGNVMEMAAMIGVEILTEEQYRRLQELGEFERKTSSWVKTPEKIRKLGGALFCDRRYDHVFAYHNGVESYYSSRGFRGRRLV